MFKIHNTDEKMKRNQEDEQKGETILELDNNTNNGKYHVRSNLVYHLFYSLLSSFFLGINLYTLISVKKNISSETVFAECAQNLWMLLLLHLIIPIVIFLVFAITTFMCLIVIDNSCLLYCTHRKTICIMLIPTILLMSYNSTMLAFGVKYIYEAQEAVVVNTTEIHNIDCMSTLKDASTAFGSNHAPLLVLMSWIFVSFDAIALVIETIFLFVIICIHFNSTNTGNSDMEKALIGSDDYAAYYYSQCYGYY